MTIQLNDVNQPLIKGVSQFEVDFVIPRMGMDLPLGIDPFLLYKSRDIDLKALHETVLTTFNRGVEYIGQGRNDLAQHLFNFPEVSSIGLGFSKTGKKGSGVGEYLTALIVKTLFDAPLLVERGVKHIEEMQLVSVGIGPDRISDITANIIKEFLIEYTQKQCELWNIPLKSGVPIENIYDKKEGEWYSGYFDLPVSPVDNTPILLVPRRMVRALPWINYGDYFKMEFSAFLRAKAVKKNISKPSESQDHLKERVTAISRNEIDRLDRFVIQKEKTASDAQPSLSYLDPSLVCKESEELKGKLSAIQPGNAASHIYQKTILEILNFLFSPELIDGKLEARTIDGTERRDIIFTNDSDKTFWSYIRAEHSAIFLMFETKNVSDLDNTHFNQVATYLGERIGRIGFIVTRKKAELAQIRKSFSIFNDSYPKKVILVLSDVDIIQMLDMVCQGQDPMRHIQSLYREFRTKAQ